MEQVSSYKVNIFVWRLVFDCLPTRVNLNKREIDIDSTLCPICSCHLEDVDHLFFTCNLTYAIWKRRCVLIDMHIPYFSNIAYMFQWIELLMVLQFKRKILELVFILHFFGFGGLIETLWFSNSNNIKKLSCLVIL